MEDTTGKSFNLLILSLEEDISLGNKHSLEDWTLSDGEENVISFSFLFISSESKLFTWTYKLLMYKF